MGKVDFGIVIPTMGVIFGWYIVHRLSISRDRDKSRREMLAKEADSLSDAVTKVFNASISYHTSPRSISNERDIKLSLQDISSRCSQLKVLCNESDLQSLASALKELRRAITGVHFEDEHGVELDQSDEKLQAIASKALLTKSELSKFKYRQFAAKK